jgi:hypothetical protein
MRPAMHIFGLAKNDQAPRWAAYQSPLLMRGLLTKDALKASLQGVLDVCREHDSDDCGVGPGCRGAGQGGTGSRGREGGAGEQAADHIYLRG